MKVKIKEHSWCTHLAARKMKCVTIAMVLGRTIHLWNISREEFLRRPAWVMHELEHVRQFQQYGFFPFCALYLWESIRRGYYNNRFEVEARRAERSAMKPEGVQFI